MTNEELAALIQCGHTECVEQLWNQVKRLVRLFANRRLLILEGRGGVDMDDLEQAGFLAMMDAVKRFDYDKDFRFTTYLDNCVKTAFRDASGYHPTRKVKYDPIDYSVSYDAPLEEDSDTFLKDVLPDSSALQAFEDVAERDEQTRLHNALETAITALSDEEADAVRAEHYCGGEVDRKAYSKAVRHLRHPAVSRQLKPYLKA